MTTNLTELTGTSKEGWKQAVQDALDRAPARIEGRVRIEVVGQAADVENGRVTEYEATIHVCEELGEKSPKSFVIERTTEFDRDWWTGAGWSSNAGDARWFDAKEKLAALRQADDEAAYPVCYPSRTIT